MQTETDIPLQYSQREKCWVLPGVFFNEYYCLYPSTKEMHEFSEKYIIPAVQSLARDIGKSLEWRTECKPN